MTTTLMPYISAKLHNDTEYNDTQHNDTQNNKSPHSYKNTFKSMSSLAHHHDICNVVCYYDEHHNDAQHFRNKYLTYPNLAHYHDISYAELGTLFHYKKCH